MQLKVNSFPVSAIRFGQQSSYDNGVLTLCQEACRALLLKDKNLQDVALDVVLPGEKTRILHILDAVIPTADMGNANCFPGFLGTPSTAGNGEMHRLEDMFLVTCGRFKTSDEILRTREAIVDMWGENAKLSPFSESKCLVLTLEMAPDVPLGEADLSARIAELKLAEYLATLTKDCMPAATAEYGHWEKTEGLPTVCLILQLASIGTLFDTYFYGRSVEGIAPTLIDINELMAGAVVSGEYFYGGQRQPTCHYQDNPIIKAMLARHGKTLSFGGVILTRGYYNTDVDKRRAASHCARLAEGLGADGVIIHAESGGNSHVDAMLTVQCCERQGIATAVILAEMGDVNSDELSLVDFVPEATAIVSAGNRELLIRIEECSKAVGGVRLMDTDLPAVVSQEVPLNHYFCSNSQLGAWNLSMDAL